MYGFDSHRRQMKELSTHKSPGQVWLEPLDSPLGGLIAGADGNGIALLVFSDEAEEEPRGPARRSSARPCPAALNSIQNLLPLLGGREAAWGSHPLLEQLKTELSEYFAGKRRDFDLPLDPSGSAFQQRVWKSLRRIPYGQTESYAQLAAATGNPAAFRAVAQANARNRIIILIPCHRVIASGGGLGGYSGGLWRKEKLLSIEGIEIGKQGGRLSR